jgi:sugar lactone lactonase YvrE
MRRVLHQQSRPTLYETAAGSPPARITKLGTKPTANVVAARRLNRAAGIIATSVLLDSAMEHYRGNFHNKAMWTPSLPPWPLSLLAPTDTPIGAIVLGKLRRFNADGSVDRDTQLPVNQPTMCTFAGVD